MSTNIRPLLIAALALAILPSQVFASPRLIEANMSSNLSEIKLSAADAGAVFRFYGQAKNKEEQSLDFDIYGPSGAVIKVESYTLIGKKSMASQAGSAGQKVNLFINNDPYKEFKLGPKSALAASTTSSASSEERLPECGCLTYREIDNLLAALRQADPGMTEDELCESLPPNPSGCGSTGPKPTPGSGDDDDSSGGSNKRGKSYFEDGGAFLPFNKCDKSAKAGFVVEISLAGVAADQLEGNVLKTKFDMRDFDRNKKASIKPKGEGKYKSPLFLASTVGTRSKTTVNMVTWRGTKRASVRKLKIADTVYYGGSLLRVPLSGLRGGKGTFEVNYYQEGYSVCAKFQAVRQYFNGYRNY